MTSALWSRGKSYEILCLTTFFSCSKMSPYLDPGSKSCIWCGSNGWLLRTERLLSASCMGWCLRASFKEHPKSTMIAYVGGASGIYLANFFFGCLPFRPPSRTAIGIMHALGLTSVGGVAWCLSIAFEEHPKAAIKSFLAGALSTCLAKSVIFYDLSDSLEETPKRKTEISRKLLDISDMNDLSAVLEVERIEQAMEIGRGLKDVAKSFSKLNFGVE